MEVDSVNTEVLEEGSAVEEVHLLTLLKHVTEWLDSEVTSAVLTESWDVTVVATLGVFWQSWETCVGKLHV